jgi:hypothetical protein
MADCEKQLRKFISSIEPTRNQKNGAKRSQNYLRDILCTGQMASRIKNHYLSGSYSRNTAIYPLDDVDIIFVIDPSFWNRKFRLLFGLSDYPAPESVLKSFANAIRYRYKDSSVNIQRRSVCLRLFHLDIDVVPAIQDQENPQLIRIPDSSANYWLTSSPLQHSENATIVNREQNGKFKPLVKLLKYWNGNLPNTAKFKSFAIETMAVRIFSENDITSLQEGLALFFDFIAWVSSNNSEFTWDNDYQISLTWLSSKIPDAADTNTNIIEGMDNERRKRFTEAAIRSRNKILDSLDTLSIETACKRTSEALRV